MAEKRVIQSWLQKARNHEQTERAGFWGLGDLLRGSNVLFNACQTLGVQYALDIQGHPVSQVFKPRSPEVAIGDSEVEFWTFEKQEDVSKRISDALMNNDTLVLNSNGGPSWPDDPSDNWKAFIKQVLRPNQSLQDHLSRVIPAEPYGVFHFRVGDGGLVRGEQANLGDAIEALERYAEPDDIVISDSLELQAYIKRHKTQIRVSEAKPVHTGLSADADSISQTMSDFFLIGGARKAKSYSAYAWPSGFVVSASRIFDVPLVSVGHKKARPKKSFFRKAISLWR